MSERENEQYYLAFGSGPLKHLLLGVCRADIRAERIQNSIAEVAEIVVAVDFPSVQLALKGIHHWNQACSR
jgi:hypothetical protein